MKKKLIQVLKTLYASKGFKANELEELADVLSSSLKEDSTDEEISNVANGAESYVNMLQKVGNRYASAIEEKYKGYVKPNVTEDKTKPIEENSLTKEAIAKLISEGIAEAIKPIQQQRESERLSQVLSSNEKLKGIPAKFISRYKLEKEEDLDNVASQIAQDYADERKVILESLGIAEPPTSGGDADSDEGFVKLMQGAQKALETKEK
jgi:chromosome segregation and condensation protein ScpB